MSDFELFAAKKVSQGHLDFCGNKNPTPPAAQPAPLPPTEQPVTPQGEPPQHS